MPVVPSIVANRVTFEAVDILEKCEDRWDKVEVRVQ